MSKKTLLQLVERLREAGQQKHLEEEAWGHGACLSKFDRPCDCAAGEHNAVVDEAAKALVAKIERMQLETFREQQRAEEDNLLNDLRTGSKT